VALDPATVEHLEEALLAADLGVPTSTELVERLRRRATGAQARDPRELRRWLAEEATAVLSETDSPAAATAWPRVSLLVGVNGTGKTTSAAKLAAWSLEAGVRPLLVAADTFRAAAGEQLEHWSRRLGMDCVRGRPGADPAAVVFDGLKAARARGALHVIVDTAGRLHTKRPLMEELAKLRRVVDREAPDWARLALLVVDATTGQNAVAQAREFQRSASLDGVLLTKLDGTAKGGVAVAIARELRLPVLYLGVGEDAGDLVEFRPREFAAALLGD
jgi:fused signal recognition particle receptor